MAALTEYSGDRFRARFVSRLWMRRVMDMVRHPGLIEAACGAMRLPPFRAVAWQVFFGRGSFPDVEMRPLPQPFLR
jgi:hypothetical protein